MTTDLNPLQARAAIVNPDRTPTEYFFRFINIQILDRLGGLAASSNSELATEIADLQGQGAEPQSDPMAQVALMGIDELRNEVASLRNDLTQLRFALFERDSELLMLRNPDLRARVEQLEDLMLKAS